MWTLTAVVMATGLALASNEVIAGPLDGRKTIKLVEQNGRSHAVATVEFSGDRKTKSYKIDWDGSQFGNHFLSMRPFKCLEGATKYWCRVPYPYKIRRMVSADDLTDLEYDLLFVWKGAKEYGINMWNGVYYRLKIDNGKLVGRLHEMDMDKLSAPPSDGALRPIDQSELELGEPDSHWLATTVIE